MNKKQMLFGGVGGALGLFVGSSMGIAAFGTAVNGAIPLAIVGIIIGVLLARK